MSGHETIPTKNYGIVGHAKLDIDNTKTSETLVNPNHPVSLHQGIHKLQTPGAMLAQ